MISQFDKANLNLVRADIDAALKAVAEKHGIELKTAGCTYSAGAFTMKLEAKCEAEKQRSADMLKQWCELRNLDSEKVSIDGYRLVGFDTKRPKRPWLAEKGGKTYVLDEAGARLRFGRAAA